MQIMNWTEVTPMGAGAEKLPAGAYVVRITDASDHTAKNGGNYLTIIYEIAEGPHAGHYESETRDWTHSFNRSYTGKAEGFFRHFLDCIEASNPGRFTVAGWTRSCNERELEGLLVGALFCDRYYTNKEGRDVGPVLDFVEPMSAQDVREAKWEFPKIRDDRANRDAAPDAAAAQAQASAYDADLPF